MFFIKNSGNIKINEPLITRYAPGFGVNTGGALEVATCPNAVHLNYFHMR